MFSDGLESPSELRLKGVYGLDGLLEICLLVGRDDILVFEFLGRFNRGDTFGYGLSRALSFSVFVSLGN
jgi:hypothetical protein